jgi:DNA-binding PucR family transcriptional regulator
VLLRDHEAISDLVETLLAPLTTARGGAQPMLDTLDAFFSNGSNTAATARQLHLSVRAVTYRLDRIRELTGLNPAGQGDQFSLHVAVLGAKLLNWPAPRTG